MRIPHNSTPFVNICVDIARRLWDRSCEVEFLLPIGEIADENCGRGIFTCVTGNWQPTAVASMGPSLGTTTPSAKKPVEPISEPTPASQPSQVSGVLMIDKEKEEYIPTPKKKSTPPTKPKRIVRCPHRSSVFLYPRRRSPF